VLELSNNNGYEAESNAINTTLAKQALSKNQPSSLSFESVLRLSQETSKTAIHKHLSLN